MSSRGGRNNRGRGRGFGNRGGQRSGSNVGREICRYFIDGRCEHGDKCRYPHVFQKFGETRGHQGIIKDLALWPAQQQLFTCSADSTIKVHYPFHDILLPSFAQARFRLCWINRYCSLCFFYNR